MSTLYELPYKISCAKKKVGFLTGFKYKSNVEYDEHAISQHQSGKTQKNLTLKEICRNKHLTLFECKLKEMSNNNQNPGDILYYCCKHGSRHCVDIYLKYFPPDSKSFIYMCKARSIAIVKKMAILDSTLLTKEAVDIACTKNHAGLFYTLIDLQCPIGYDAIRHVIYNKNDDFLITLVQHNCPINEQEFNFIYKNGSLELINALIDSNSKYLPKFAKIVCRYGDTRIFNMIKNQIYKDPNYIKIACQHNQVNLTHLMIQNGWKLNKNLVDIAYSSLSPNVLELLLNNNCPYNYEELRYKCEKDGRYDAIKVLDDCVPDDKYVFFNVCKRAEIKRLNSMISKINNGLLEIDTITIDKSLGLALSVQNNRTINVLLDSGCCTLYFIHLQLACENRNVPIIKKLLDMGCPIKQGSKSIFDFETKKIRNDTVLKILLKYNEKYTNNVNIMDFFVKYYETRAYERFNSLSQTFIHQSNLHVFKKYINENYTVDDIEPIEREFLG